ncbi:hypothetical protein JCM21900_001823 [Sporobolomyces salmonicolor]
MGSSSDIEILPAAPPKPASPPRPRRTGRARNPARSVDELASSAAVSRATARESTRTLRKSHEDAFTSAVSELAVDGRHADIRGAAPSAAPTSLAPVPSLRRAPPSLVPEVLPVASTSSAAAPVPSLPTALPCINLAPSSSAPTIRPKRISPSPTTSRAPSSTGPSRPASQSTRQPLPAAKPAGGNSSDEADDFFARRKAAAMKARVPGRVPGIARKRSVPVAGSSRRAATPAATTPPKATTRRDVPSGSSDSDTSNSSVPNRGGESSDPDAMTKSIQLPDWARGASFGRPGQSGADAAKAARGYKPTRKRKRLSDSDSSEGEGKGKGKAKEAGTFAREERDDTDDSLEIELGGRTPKKVERPKRPAKPMLLGDDDEDSDDNEPPAPQPKAAPQKERSATVADLLASVRSELSSPANSSPRPAHIYPRSPGASSSPRQETHLSIGSSSESEDPALMLDPALAAIRYNFASRSRKPSLSPAPGLHDDDFEIVGGLAQPVGIGAGLGLDDGGDAKVTVVLRMTFDPTRTNVSAMAKRAYEREERFEIGLNEPFASLFCMLASRRVIEQSDLIITYNKAQLYEFGTAKSLRLSAGSLAQMRGYTHEVWEKVKALDREKAERGEPEDENEFAGLAAPWSPSRTRSRSPATASPAPDSSPDKAPGLFPLTIRGSRTQAISLALKPTTTMSALVKAYCKQFAITDPARIARMWIEFDGDKLEASKTVAEVKDEFELEGEEAVDLREGGP